MSDVSPSDISSSDILTNSELCSSDVSGSESCSPGHAHDRPKANSPTIQQVGYKGSMGERVPQPAMMNISSLQGAESIVKQLKVVDEAAIVKAATTLSDWGIHTSANQTILAKAGAIPSLIHLLNFPSAAVKERVAHALCSLAVGHNANKTAITTAGALPPLVRLMSAADVTLQHQAVCTLDVLAQGNYPNQTAIAEAGAIFHLVILLQSPLVSLQERVACALSNLAVGHDSNRTAIVNMGGVLPLVNLLGSPSIMVKEQAVSALRSLAVGCEANRAAIVEAGGLPGLVSVLRESESEAAQCHAASALRNLALGNTTTRTAIVHAGAITPLVSMLESRSHTVQLHAAGALWEVSIRNQPNQDAIVDAGAVPPLIAMLHSRSASAQEHAAGTLGSLAESNPLNQTTIADAGAIPPLITLMRSASDSAQQHAANALGHLAAGHEANMLAITEAGVMRPLVALLSSTFAVVQYHAACTLRVLCWLHPGNQEAAVESDVVIKLVHLLHKGASTPVQGAAAGVLATLAYTVADNRVRIMQADALTYLLPLLKLDNEYTQQAAAECLMTLACSNAEHAVLVQGAGAVPYLKHLLKERTTICKAGLYAMGALCILLDDPKDDYQRRQYIGRIVDWLSLANSSDDFKESAAATLMVIAQDNFSNVDTIKRAGAVPVLEQLKSVPKVQAAAIAALRAMKVAKPAPVAIVIQDDGFTSPGRLRTFGAMPRRQSDRPTWRSQLEEQDRWFPSPEKPSHSPAVQIPGLFDHSNHTSHSYSSGDPSTVFNYSGTMSLDLLWGLAPDVGGDRISVRIFNTIAFVDPSKLSLILSTVIAATCQMCNAVLVCKVQAMHLEQRVTSLEPFLQELTQFVRVVRPEQIVQKVLPSCNQLYSALQAAKKLLEELPQDEEHMVQFMKKVFVATGLVKEFQHVNKWLADVVKDLTVYVDEMYLSGMDLAGILPDSRSWHQESVRDHEEDVRELANQVLQAFGGDAALLQQQLSQEHMDVRLWVKHVTTLGADTQALMAMLPASQPEPKDSKEGVRDELREFLSALEGLYLQGSKLDSDEPHPDLPPFCIPRDAVEDDDSVLVGVGGFGQVYRATYQGHPVAVKVFANNRSMGKAMRRRVITEAYIMSKMRGPSVVQFYGVIVDPQKGPWDMALVTELIEGDSLFDLVHDEYEEVSAKQAVHWCLQAAQSVKYLHDMPQPYGPVVHGDLKTSNFMVLEHNNLLKMIDFGCATVSKATRRLLVTTTGAAAKSTKVPDSDHSVLYTAPEMWQCIQDERDMQRTTQSDVYALGVLFYEVCTCSVPFESWGWSASQIEQGVCAGKRPPLGKLKEYPSLVEVIQMCWAQEPSERASLDWVCKRLQEILKKS